MITQLDLDRSSNWVSSLPDFQRELIRELVSSGIDSNKVAEIWLSRTGPDNNAGFGANNQSNNYFSSVKVEIRKLICGDPEYESTRIEAKKIWNGPKYGIISLMSIAISSQIGVAAAVIIPILAIILDTTAKIGVNAWCALPEGNQPTLKISE